MYEIALPTYYSSSTSISVGGFWLSSSILSLVIQVQELRIVRKELLPNAIQEEFRVLTILRHLKHPNLLELIGSYTYLGKAEFTVPIG